MLAAQPPRRTSRSSTRNESAILSSWSTTRESANLPGKVIRWSVAMEPVTSSGTAWSSRVGSGQRPVTTLRAPRDYRRRSTRAKPRPAGRARARPRPGNAEGPRRRPATGSFLVLWAAGGSVEGVTTGAGAGRVRVVDRETLLLDGVDEV